MDVRRFYVVSSHGERGPFSIEELVEELDAGRITAAHQVRTGMGTMLGSVQDVIAGAEPPRNLADSGSGLVPVQRVGHRRLSLLILALTFVPALLLIGLFGIGTTRSTVAPETAPIERVPRPPETPPSTQLATPATPATSPSIPVSNQPTTTKSEPVRVPTRVKSSITQAADGSLALTATTATITNKDARLVVRAIPPAIFGWSGTDGGAEWTTVISQPGSFVVTITYACTKAGSDSVMGLTAGNHTITEQTRSTGSWDDYQQHQLQQHLTITHPGETKIVLSPVRLKNSVFIKFTRIDLVPVR